MGRKPLGVRPAMVRIAEDTLQRIDTLVGRQKRASFIREAVENELARRDAEQNKA